MADPRTPPLVRLGESGELAAALPHLLGFRPAESLVVVSLRGRPGRAGDGGRIGLTARIDLPPAAARAVAVDRLVEAVRSDAPAAVVLAVVSEAADEMAPPAAAGRGRDGAPVLPHRALLEVAEPAFTAAGVPVRESLLVRRGRWWSYGCTESCCRPAAGTPLPTGTSPLAAASALAGQVVAADRAELQRRIAPVGFLAAAGMARTCDEVGTQLAARTDRVGAAAVAAESWTLLAEAVQRMQPGSVRTIPDREVARLAWGLLDDGVRDRAMGWALGFSAAAAEVLWTDLTRRAPAPLDAVPATLLAVTAWVRGDGALANVALDRALSSRPAHRLALLLRSALDACIPPADVRRLIRESLGDRAAG